MQKIVNRYMTLSLLVATNCNFLNKLEVELVPKAIVLWVDKHADECDSAISPVKIKLRGRVGSVWSKFIYVVIFELSKSPFLNRRLEKERFSIVRMS